MTRPRGRRRDALVGLTVAAALTGNLAQAQTGGPVPDLDGIFAGRRCIEGGETTCPELSPAGAAALLTARARAFAGAFDELAAPKYDCGPATLPGLFSDPYAFQVEQRSDRVIFTYEKDDIVRTVWLEGHGHPEPRVGEFFLHGRSTGRYEGDGLVVETGRFVFDPAGIAGDAMSAPSSTQKRMVERYWREGDDLRMELTVEDPIFLTGPIRYVMAWRPSDRPLALPWACDPEAARRNLRLIGSKYPEDPPVERRE